MERVCVFACVRVCVCVCVWGGGGHYINVINAWIITVTS